MVKKFFLLCLLAMSIFLVACDSKEVSFVKDTPLSKGNPDITYGSVLEDYPFASNAQWLELENGSKQKVIKYTAQYDALQFISFYMHKNVFSDDFKRDVKEILDKHPINLVVEFTYHKPESFKLSYVGFECEDERLERDFVFMKSDFDLIAAKEPIMLDAITPKAEKLLSYAVRKTLFDHWGEEDFAFACGFDVTKGGIYGYKSTIGKYYATNLLVFTVNNFKFDDKTFDITADLTYDVTDMRKGNDGGSFYKEDEIDEFLSGRKSLLKETLPVSLIGSFSSFIYSLNYGGVSLNFAEKDGVAFCSLVFRKDAGAFNVTDAAAKPGIRFKEAASEAVYRR